MLTSIRPLALAPLACGCASAPRPAAPIAAETVPRHPAPPREPESESEELRRNRVGLFVGNARFVLRLAAGWDFELGGGFALTPDRNYDLVAGDSDTVVLGVAGSFSS